MSSLASALVILTAPLGTPTVARGQADAPCPAVGACFYRAPAFSIRIVDQETGQPIAGAHAMAIWLEYGTYGQRGPLMALEATSAPDGTLTFPGWGPLPGSRTGLVPQRDPAISVFKPGFRTLLIANRTPLQQRLNSLTHAFAEPGQTFGLLRSSGDHADTFVDLQKAADPLVGTGLSPHALRSIRRVFVNRWILIRLEAQKLPAQWPGLNNLLWRLDTGIETMGRDR